jgi:hypothetical protein
MMIALVRWINSARAETESRDAQGATQNKRFAEPKRKRSTRAGKNRLSRREP